MIELEMYLVAQPEDNPWPIVPRSLWKTSGATGPFSKFVSTLVAKELVAAGFIQPTSPTIFVVSQFGRRFYERHLKPTTPPSIPLPHSAAEKIRAFTGAAGV
jgi:hypothetical protein